MELTFRPTAGEVVHGYLARFPRWAVYVVMAVALLFLPNLVPAPRYPLLQTFAAWGVLLGVPYALALRFARPTAFGLDERGVWFGPPGQTTRLAWADVRVRATSRAYVFHPGVAVPLRALGGAERRVIDEALAAHPARVLRREAASLVRVFVCVVAFMSFLTWYNLCQSSGKTRRSSLEMPASTSATGRSSFIEPTI